jgi:hypothetical protein
LPNSFSLGMPGSRRLGASIARAPLASDAAAARAGRHDDTGRRRPAGAPVEPGSELAAPDAVSCARGLSGGFMQSFDNTETMARNPLHVSE